MDHRATGTIWPRDPTGPSWDPTVHAVSYSQSVSPI